MNILVVDDHMNTCLTLSTILRREGFNVAVATSGAKALKLLREEQFDVVITDLKLGDMDGIEVLTAARQQSARTEVIVMTAFGSVASAVKAMKIGAYDYISKPLQRKEVLSLIGDVLAKRALAERIPFARTIAGDDAGDDAMLGQTPAMMEMRRMIAAVAGVDVPVLINGETGTGKELVAKLIHRLSKRREKPFIAINCGSLPQHLQESELFGHARGAFTGAVEQRRGLFEEATGGTLLLDEIGEMEMQAQVKLLRVLQDGEVRQVGSNRTCHVDTRVLAATNRPLQVLVDNNIFRRDLFFRINVMCITLPPLRERVDDIALLAQHFITKYAARYEKHVAGIDDRAVDLLRRHPWPGNVRELENCLKRAIILCTDDSIHVENLEIMSAPGAQPSRGKGLADHERMVILEALTATRWNQKQAAARLGIGVTTLWRKIKKYGLKHEHG